MIKDILVHIPTERPMRPVIDASISIAAAFGAHLDALAIGAMNSSAMPRSYWAVNNPKVAEGSTPEPRGQLPSGGSGHSPAAWRRSMRLTTH
jgi:hypothetical protein